MGLNFNLLFRIENISKPTGGAAVYSYKDIHVLMDNILLF